MKTARKNNTLDEGLKNAIEDKLNRFGFQWEVDQL
jgi:hypothetical protein